MLRFNPTIKKTIVKTLQNKAHENPLHKITVEESRIDDLVQAVYLKLVQDNRQALRNFKNDFDPSIYSYLSVIAVNVVKDFFREVNAVKRPNLAVSLDALLGENGDNVLLGEGSRVEENQFAEMLNEEEQEAILQLIDEAFRLLRKWKNRDRDVLMFKLRIIHGLKLKEIANLMNLDLSPVTISSIVNRTLKKVKPVLLAMLKKTSGDGK
ncbi:MAG: sigma-70 family RNA polymerase sigma factor [Acidobacteriota bacterium]